MKTKTLQFTCIKCNSEVYRLGKKVDIKHKTCGKCIDKSLVQLFGDSNLKPPSKVVETKNSTKGDMALDDVFKTPNPQIEPLQTTGDKTQDILARVEQYRVVLSKVVELVAELKQDHSETFLTLWGKAKG